MLRSALLSLLPLTSAHFLLNYPPARGFNEDSIGRFPCGGFDSATSNRTAWPLSGGPVQLWLSHTSSHIQVLLALGNEPGSAFNTVLVPTFSEQGPDNFCLGSVVVPPALGLKAGDNATIQVVTNGDPNGGLYNCADITFTSAPLSADQFGQNCRNSTGAQTRFSCAAGINANQTTSDSCAAVAGASGASSSRTATASASASASGAASASASSGRATAASSGLAARETLAKWVVGAVGVVGGLAVL